MVGGVRPLVEAAGGKGREEERQSTRKQDLGGERASETEMGELARGRVCVSYIQP